MLDNKDKQQIVEKLEEKIKDIKCPICNNKQFIISDGYFNNHLQTDFRSISIGGSSIPTIAIICNNCGFTSQHSLGILGLLPKEPDNKDERG